MLSTGSGGENRTDRIGRSTGSLEQLRRRADDPVRFCAGTGRQWLYYKTGHLYRSDGPQVSGRTLSQRETNDSGSGQSFPDGSDEQPVDGADLYSTSGNKSPKTIFPL